MADDPTIAIESLEQLRDRLRGANFSADWENFSTFLRRLESAADKKTEDPAATVDIDGTVFPLDETIRFLPAYFQAYFIEDVFTELDTAAKNSLTETIAAVIDEKAQTLQDTWEILSRRRKTQVDFLATFRNRIDTLLPTLTATTENVSVQEALEAILLENGSLSAAANPVSPRLIEDLEEIFKDSVVVKQQFTQPNDILISDTQRNELSERTKLKQKDAKSLTEEDLIKISHLEPAENAIKTAQAVFKETLKEKYSEAVTALPHADTKSLLEAYTLDENFRQFLVTQLTKKYTQEIPDFSSVQALGFIVRDLLETVQRITQEFVEKTRQTHATELTAAQKALNAELAQIFGIAPDDDFQDSGGNEPEDEDEAKVEEDEDEEELKTPDDAVAFAAEITALGSALDSILNQLPDTRLARTQALSRLQDIHSDGSRRARITADSVVEFMSRLAAIAEELSPTDREAILSGISQYIAGLETQLEQLDSAELPGSAVPQVEPTETSAPEAARTPTVGQTGELLRVQSLLVLEAQNEIRLALEKSNFSEVQINELLDAYHDDISNLVWNEFLDIGGYNRQRIGDRPSYAELARIWTASGKTILQKIQLDARVSGAAVSYDETAAPTTDQISRAQDILSQAGLEDPTTTVELLSQLRDPVFFQNLVGQANTIAQLHTGLKDSFSATGTYNDQNLQQLIGLLLPYLPPHLQNSVVARDLATLGVEGNASRLLRSADFEQRFQNLNILQKSGAWFRLRELSRLIEKLESNRLNAEETKKLEELLQEFVPLFSILRDGKSNEVFYYVVGAEELNRFSQVLAETHQQELAVAQRMEAFTATRDAAGTVRSFSYNPYPPTGPSLRSYLTPSQTQTVQTVETTETTTYLLTQARDNVLLKKLVIASLMNDALINDVNQQLQVQALYNQLSLQHHAALETLLFRPDFSHQSQMPQTTESGQMLTPAGSVAQIQRQNPQEKIQKMRQFARQARLAKTLLASGGNPALFAANLLKDPEGRKMLMTAIKAMVAMIMANILFVLGMLMAILGPLIAAWNAITQFISSVAKGIADFASGVTGAGGGATTTAMGSIGTASGQAVVAGTKNAASTAHIAGNELLQQGRAELTNAASTSGAKASAIISGTVAAETSAAVIGAGLLGPMLLLTLFTIIVMTVIGASMNDIPMGGVLRSASQGGLGVAGCWPADGAITVLETYEDGSPHATSPGGSAIDIGNAPGTPVYTPFSGTAQAAWDAEGYGNYVIIETTYGFTVYLAHLSEACVPSQTGGCLRAGQSGPITAGQQVGLMGSTGNSTGSHLHYEVLNLPSSYATSSYPIAGIVPPEPPLAVGARVSTSQCGTSEEIELNACFNFRDGEGTWQESEKIGIETTILAIQAYGSEEFQRNLCGKGPIRIIRQSDSVSTDGFPYSGEVINSSTIYIYDYCFDNSQADCQFTFPHELGHIYHTRTPILTDYISATVSEDLVFTYPLPEYVGSSGGNYNREKFAEAFGVYIGQEWLGFTTNRCLPGFPNTEQGNENCESFSLQNRYPLQYQFLQENVF